MSGLTELLARVEALRFASPIDYATARRLEYEIAVLYPPMESPAKFLRDAKDPATLDHIIKMDVYDGIPRYLAHLDGAASFVERNLPAWQWAMWGGAIEIGSTVPRCYAHVSDGNDIFQSVEFSSAAPALMCAALRALISRTPATGGKP